MKKKLVIGLIIIFLLVVAGFSLNSGGPRGSFKGLSTIGVIEINGQIVGSPSGLMGGTGVSSADIMTSIQAAREREDIKAVVLRINSPGGAAAASQEIGIELDKLRAAGKPVITSMGDVCASGGYWIACGSNYIVANGASITGSIGAIMEVTNLEGLYEKLGVTSRAIKSGAHKDMGSPTREMTAQEQEMLQAIVDDSFEQFLQQVEKGRQGKLTHEELLAIADGRVFSGRQALELGLVDSLGNYYDAISMAEKMAGLQAGASVEVLNSDRLWNRLRLNMNTLSLFDNQSVYKLQ